MAVRINGPVPPGSVGRPTGRPTAKKTEDTAEAGSRAEKVSLSEKEGAIAVAKAASRGVGEVDEAKVARLRAEIQAGEYKPDLKVVAERIIAEAVNFQGG